jgi:hypothetical protein
MKKAEKGIELVRSINREWLAELENDKTLCILMDEPFTDDYWTEKYKIVLCNLESGDQSKTGKLLDLNCFKAWLEEKKSTVKKSALFLYCLHNKLQGNDIDKQKMTIAKNDNELLLNTMKKVTYMNFLKDAGTSCFDKKYFWDFFSDEKNKKHTVDLINALSPDVFIVTSDGIVLTEQLFKVKFVDHLAVYNNTLFVGLGHPSRCFNDNYILNWVNVINEKLKKLTE